MLLIDEHARGHLRENLEAADRFRSVAFAAVVGVLGVALIAMLYFARRMALDVLRRWRRFVTAWRGSVMASWTIVWSFRAALARVS
jgi:hypothetical protein